MERPAGFLNLVAKTFGENKTHHFILSPGDFFDGGELTISVKKLSVGESIRLGLDPKRQRRQLYCEGKFLRDGREFHFVLIDYGGKYWLLKQIEVGVLENQIDHGFKAYPGFLSSEKLYSYLMETLIKA